MSGRNNTDVYCSQPVNKSSTWILKNGEVPRVKVLILKFHDNMIRKKPTLYIIDKVFTSTGQVDGQFQTTKMRTGLKMCQHSTQMGTHRSVIQQCSHNQ
ncbi:hypothetical protein HanRHA438_Chr03g0104641 [Helianthus annuus]|nr:hypothetical protein HanRHA438_Chr03g0104641 [Helianthus annuus]